MDELVTQVTCPNDHHQNQQVKGDPGGDESNKDVNDDVKQRIYHMPILITATLSIGDLRQFAKSPESKMPSRGWLLCILKL
jgi:hypothetical protein